MPRDRRPATEKDHSHRCHRCKDTWECQPRKMDRATQYDCSMQGGGICDECFEVICTEVG